MVRIKFRDLSSLFLLHLKFVVIIIFGKYSKDRFIKTNILIANHAFVEYDDEDNNKNLCYLQPFFSISLL